MLTFAERSMGNLLDVQIRGKLTHEDYQKFKSRLEDLIQQYGKVRVLLELEDFQGAELAAVWDDFTFGLRHLSAFQRCAVVGDKAWEGWVVSLGKPFFRVKYFDESQRDEAWRWLWQTEEETVRQGGILGRFGNLVREHPVPAALVGIGLGLLAFNLARRRLGRSQTELAAQTI
jgi:hypothetical protein